jgi:rRNA maturation protein Rpf1
MIITTSRRPSTRSRHVCKELNDVIPLSRYIVRGKKGMRELIQSSVEKGADRILVVHAAGDMVTLLFYEEWNLLGSMKCSAVLRRELGFRRVKPIQEDLPFIMISSDPGAGGIANLFGAEFRGPDSESHEDLTLYLHYHQEVLDFYRLDISDEPVGPRIAIREIAYAGNN